MLVGIVGLKIDSANKVPRYNEASQLQPGVRTSTVTKMSHGHEFSFMSVNHAVVGTQEYGVPNVI